MRASSQVTVFAQSDKTYGSPRIYREFKEGGIGCSERRVARLMRRNSIRAQLPKPFVVTTDSRHALPVHENLLERQFEAQTADTPWSCDITSLWTGEGWLYLSVVLDLFSRRIVGGSLQKTRERTLVTQALEMALLQRNPSEGLLRHSDQGSQYASHDYQALLEEAGIVCPG